MQAHLLSWAVDGHRYSLITIVQIYWTQGDSRRREEEYDRGTGRAAAKCGVIGWHLMGNVIQDPSQICLKGNMQS